MKISNFIKRISFAFNCLLLALFLVSQPLPGLGTTRILSGFLVIMLLAIKWRKVRSRILPFVREKNIKTAMGLFAICFFIALIHSVIDIGGGASYNENFMPHYIIYIVLFSFILPLYCLVSFDSLREFVFAWTIIIIIEAIVVIFAVVNHGFAVYVFEHFYDSERFVNTVEKGMRIVGIGIAGSSGSIAMSTGFMAISFLYLKQQIPSIVYFTIGIIVLLSTLFVGRTGVLCSIVYFATIFFLRRQSMKVYILLSIALFVLLFGVNYLLSHTLQGDGLLMWMTEAFQSEAQEEVLNEIYDQYELPFSLFGTGLTRGKALNGAYCLSDSGYLQSFFAFGVLGFICYYLGAFMMIKGSLKNTHGKIKKYLLVSMLMAFAIELKEGFFMRYVNTFMVVSLSLFASLDSIKRESKKKGVTPTINKR